MGIINLIDSFAGDPWLCAKSRHRLSQNGWGSWWDYVDLQIERVATYLSIKDPRINNRDQVHYHGQIGQTAHRMLGVTSDCCRNARVGVRKWNHSIWGLRGWGKLRRIGTRVWFCVIVWHFILRAQGLFYKFNTFNTYKRLLVELDSGRGKIKTFNIWIEWMRSNAT